MDSSKGRMESKALALGVFLSLAVFEVTVVLAPKAEALDSIILVPKAEAVVLVPKAEALDSIIKNPKAEALDSIITRTKTLCLIYYSF